MQLFAHKQNQLHAQPSALPASAPVASTGQLRAIHPILYLQQRIGNQALQRLIDDETKHPERNASAPDKQCEQHTFNPIPLHVMAGQSRAVAGSSLLSRLQHQTPLWVQRQPSSAVEAELDPVAPAESERLRQQGMQLPSVSAQTGAAIGGAPYTTILPGYSQAGDTCGAASLVTALLIWDREHWSAAQPNSHVVTGCNLILTALARHRPASIRRWTAHPAPDVSRGCGGDRACIEQVYDLLSQRLTRDLQQIRDAGRQPGARISEHDYQTMGMTLYFLWHEGGRAGLSTMQIGQIQSALGLRSQAAGASTNIQSFDAIFTDPTVTTLQPDQFAQIAWFVNTGGQHIFLLGRLQGGEWFLSDQGPQPAVEFRSPTLPDLHNAVRFAATTGSYWLFVGTSVEYISRFGILPSWTGITRLGPRTGVETQAQNIVAPGAFLGEVDAGYTTIGERLTRVGFVARRYSLADAQAQFSATANGGLIIELPQGVFSLYTISAVSPANLAQTSLDSADSSGGVLTGRAFHHAWLILGTTAGRHGTWFSIY